MVVRHGVLTAVGIAGAGLLGFPAAPGHAASPGAVTISFAHAHVSWSNAAPLNGYGQGATCNATSCDDVTLTVDRGSDADAVLRLRLTMSSPSRAVVDYYPPGCPTRIGTCELQQDPTTLTIPYVSNGRSMVRVGCQPCVQGAYTVDATLTHGTLPPLPAPGQQDFNWQAHVLPIEDSGSGPLTILSFGEPGISINRRGHVIVNTLGMTVWISEDDGRTFTGAIHPDSTPCQMLPEDIDAQVSADDVYYAANLCAAGPTNLVDTSRDGGRTWNGGHSTSPGVAGTASDRQWITTDPANPGTVYVSDRAISGGQVILVYKSTDYGQTFGPPAEVHLTDSQAAQTSANGLLSSRPLVDPTDSRTISLLYQGNSQVTTLPTTADYDVTQIYVAQSHDGGTTWSSALAYDAGQTAGMDNTIAHTFVPAAVDGSGNIYVALSLRRGDQTQTHVMLGVIPRGSTTMRAPVQVDTGGLGANVFPWLASGDPGMVDLSWYGSVASDNNDVHAAWSEMFAQSVNALSAHPTFVQSRVSGAVPMHAADICTAGTSCTGNRWLEDFQGIDVDPCGMAQLVWADDHTTVGSTMYARQTAGSSVRPAACRRAVTLSSHARATGDSGIIAAVSMRTRGLPDTAAPGTTPVAPMALGALAIVGGAARRKLRR